MYIDILKKKIFNTCFKVKIRLKKLKDERYSIILDYHYFESGVEHRERKALSIYVTGQKRYYSQEKNKIQYCLPLQMITCSFTDIIAKMGKTLTTFFTKKSLYFAFYFSANSQYSL